MLAQTVRKNLKDINNLKMRRKTTKFSNLFQTKPTEGVKEPDFVKVLAKTGMFEIPRDEAVLEDSSELKETKFVLELPVSSQMEDEEEAYVFVENPREVVVNFPIVSDIVCEQKLPFFKALSFKLANL